MLLLDRSRPHPRERLGAVTRLKNEIVNLLDDVPSNLVLIRTLYNEYLSKVEALYNESQDESGSLLEFHVAEIEEFKTKMGLLISPTPPLDSTRLVSEAVRPKITIGNKFLINNVAARPRSKASRRSRQSSNSATSSSCLSTRIQIVQLRAIAQAALVALKKSSELKHKKLELNIAHEQRVLQLEIEIKIIEMDRKQHEADILENELFKLENNLFSSRGSLGNDNTSDVGPKTTIGNKFLIENVAAKPRNKISRRSRQSSNSAVSSSLTARIQIAQQRAKAQAAVAASQKSIKLKKQKLELNNAHELSVIVLENNLKIIEMEKKQHEADILENELSKLKNNLFSSDESLGNNITDSSGKPVDVVDLTKKDDKSSSKDADSTQSGSAATEQGTSSIGATKKNEIIAEFSACVIAAKDSTSPTAVNNGVTPTMKPAETIRPEPTRVSPEATRPAQQAATPAVEATRTAPTRSSPEATRPASETTSPQATKTLQTGSMVHATPIPSPSMGSYPSMPNQYSNPQPTKPLQETPPTQTQSLPVSPAHAFVKETAPPRVEKTVEPEASQPPVEGKTGQVAAVATDASPGVTVSDSSAAATESTVEAVFPAAETNGVTTENEIAQLAENIKNTLVVNPPEMEVVKQEENAAEAPVEEAVAADSTLDAAVESTKPSLVITYREGYWNPMDQRGKKAYDKFQFLQIKELEASKVKPAYMPKYDIVRDSINTDNVMERRPPVNMPMPGMDFTPNFIRGASGGYNSNNKVYGKMDRGDSNSMQGHRNTEDAKPTIKATLKTTENAWSSTVVRTETSQGPNKLKSSLIGFLNKLTPENYEKVQPKIKALIIENPEFSQVAINVFYNKAIDEPHFSAIYAKVCKSIVENNLSKDKDPAVVKSLLESVTKFKRDLLVKCQNEFERTHQFGAYQVSVDRSLKEIEKCTDEEIKKQKMKAHEERFENKLLEQIDQMKAKILAAPDSNKKELEEELEYLENKFRKRSVGLIKFVGELYKTQLLTLKIMLPLLEKFGGNVNRSHTAEALCKLMTIVGAVMWNESKDSEKNTIREVMDRCRDFTKTSIVENRIRFLLLDIIELYDNKFIPKHKSQQTVGPSTKQKVHNKMIMEEENEKITLNNNIRSSNIDTRDRRGGRGSMNKELLVSDSGASSQGQAGTQSRTMGQQYMHHNFPHGQVATVVQGRNITGQLPFLVKPHAAPYYHQQDSSGKPVDVVDLTKKDDKSSSEDSEVVQLPVEGNTSQVAAVAQDASTGVNVSESSAAATESTLEPKKSTVVIPYRNGCWNPTSQSGKKAYDRFQFLQIKELEASKVKPANMPKYDIVRDNINTHIVMERTLPVRSFFVFPKQHHIAMPDVDFTGETPLLGPGGSYSAWGFGASEGSGANKDNSRGGSMSGGEPRQQSNRFIALQDDDMPDYNNINNKRSSNRLIRDNPFKSNSHSQNTNSYDRKLTRPEMPVKKPLNTEAIREKTVANIEEYCSIQDIKEAVLDIESKFESSELPYYVYSALIVVFEMKDMDRESLGKLFEYLLVNKKISYYNLVEGLKLLVADVDDLACDIPQIQDYIGKVLAPLVFNSLLPLSELQSITASETEKVTRTFAKALIRLSILNKEILLTLWYQSRLKFEALLGSESAVNQFFDRYEELKYLNEKEENQRVEVYCNCLKKSLFKPVSTEKIKRIVATVVGSGIPAPFKPMSDEQVDCVFEKLSALKLVMKSEGLESKDNFMAVLYGLQAIAVLHSVPPGLLETLFSNALDAGVVDEANIMDWEKNPDQKLMGNCVASFGSFLRTLKMTKE